MDQNKKISALALAGIIVTAPAAMALNCNNVEITQLLVDCDSRWARIPVGCDSLIDLSFPPHNEEGPIGGDSSTTRISVIGGNNTTNVAAMVVESTSGGNALTVSEDYWYNPILPSPVRYQLPYRQDPDA